MDEPAVGDESIDIYDDIGKVPNMEINEEISDSSHEFMELFHLEQSESTDNNKPACPVNSILTNLIQLGTNLVDNKPNFKPTEVVLSNFAQPGRRPALANDNTSSDCATRSCEDNGGTKQYCQGKDLANKPGTTRSSPDSTQGFTTRRPSFLHGEESSMGLDLYEDIIGNVHHQKQTSLSEMEQKLKASLEETHDLRLKLQTLEEQHNQLQNDYDNIKKNCAVLYRTARLEVGRKMEQIRRVNNRLQKFELYLVRRHGGRLPLELQDDSDYTSPSPHLVTNYHKQQFLMKSTPPSCTALPKSRSASPCNSENKLSSDTDVNQKNNENPPKPCVVKNINKEKDIREPNNKISIESKVVDLRHKLFTGGRNTSSKNSSVGQDKDDKVGLKDVERESSNSQTISKFEICEEDQLKSYLNLAKSQERLYSQQAKSKKSNKDLQSKNPVQKSDEPSTLPTSASSAVTKTSVEKMGIGQSSSCEDTDDDKLVMDILSDNSNSTDKSFPCIDHPRKESATADGKSLQENILSEVTVSSSVNPVEEVSAVEENHVKKLDLKLAIGSALFDNSESMEECGRKSTCIIKQVPAIVKEEEISIMPIQGHKESSEGDKTERLIISGEISVVSSSLKATKLNEKSEHKHSGEIVVVSSSHKATKLNEKSEHKHSGEIGVVSSSHKATKLKEKSEHKHPGEISVVSSSHKATKLKEKSEHKHSGEISVVSSSHKATKLKEKSEHKHSDEIGSVSSSLKETKLKEKSEHQHMKKKSSSDKDRLKGQKERADRKPVSPEEASSSVTRSKSDSRKKTETSRRHSKSSKSSKSEGYAKTDSKSDRELEKHKGHSVGVAKNITLDAPDTGKKENATKITKVAPDELDIEKALHFDKHNKDMNITQIDTPVLQASNQVARENTKVNNNNTCDSKEFEDINKLKFKIQDEVSLASMCKTSSNTPDVLQSLPSEESMKNRMSSEEEKKGSSIAMDGKNKLLNEHSKSKKENVRSRKRTDSTKKEEKGEETNTIKIVESHVAIMMEKEKNSTPGKSALKLHERRLKDTGHSRTQKRSYSTEEQKKGLKPEKNEQFEYTCHQFNFDLADGSEEKMLTLEKDRLVIGDDSKVTVEGTPSYLPKVNDVELFEQETPSNQEEKKVLKEHKSKRRRKDTEVQKKNEQCIKEDETEVVQKTKETKKSHVSGKCDSLYDGQGKENGHQDGVMGDGKENKADNDPRKTEKSQESKPGKDGHKRNRSSTEKCVEKPSSSRTKKKHRNGHKNHDTQETLSKPLDRLSCGKLEELHQNIKSAVVAINTSDEALNISAEKHKDCENLFEEADENKSVEHSMETDKVNIKQTAVLDQNLLVENDKKFDVIGLDLDSPFAKFTKNTESELHHSDQEQNVPTRDIFVCQSEEIGQISSALQCPEGVDNPFKIQTTKEELGIQTNEFFIESESRIMTSVITDVDNKLEIKASTTSMCHILDEKVLKSSDKSPRDINTELDFSDNATIRDHVLSGEDTLINESGDNLDLLHGIDDSETTPNTTNPEIQQHKNVGEDDDDNVQDVSYNTESASSFISEGDHSFTSCPNGTASGTPQKSDDDCPVVNMADSSPWKTPVWPPDVNQKYPKQPIFDEETVMSTSDVLEIHAKGNLDFEEDSNLDDDGHDIAKSQVNEDNIKPGFMDKIDFNDLEEGQIDSDSIDSERDGTSKGSRKNADLREKLQPKKRKASCSPVERKRRKDELRDSGGRSRREPRAHSNSYKTKNSSRLEKDSKDGSHARNGSPVRKYGSSHHHDHRSKSPEKPSPESHSSRHGHNRHRQESPELNPRYMSVSERKKLALERARARELDKKLKSKDRETALLREKLRQLEWENFIRQKERDLERELEKVRAEEGLDAKSLEGDEYILERERGRDGNKSEKSSHNYKGPARRRHRSVDRRSPSPHSSGARHKSRERNKCRTDRKGDSEGEKETHMKVYVKYQEKKDNLNEEKETTDQLRKEKSSCTKRKGTSTEVGKHKHSREHR